jgi:divalent metal cation (Fe/Co/Zn/Cd) transporter
MVPPSLVKAAAYKKARNIGILLTLFQLFILLVLAASRTLWTDTLHSIGDLTTLAGTAYLLGSTWESAHEFEHQKQKWLLFGVWSLALGGIIIAGEAASHIYLYGLSAPPPSWPIIIAALAGALGNWRMHHILDSVEHSKEDVLHKNNIDHVKWDMILSSFVFISGILMYLSHTTAFDHFIAIVVGLLVLPYLALKRWREHKKGHHH